MGRGGFETRPDSPQRRQGLFLPIVRGTVRAGGHFADDFVAFAAGIVGVYDFVIAEDAVGFRVRRITARAELNGNTVGFGSGGNGSLTDLTFVHRSLAIY